MARGINGWHVTAMFAGFFGTVIAVNFTMAAFASSTFGGIVVENSYVASQNYNDWLAQAKASKELGWTVSPQRDGNGRLVLLTESVPTGAAVSAVARHPVGHQPDIALTFDARLDGRYIAREELPAGRWTLRTTISSGDDVWKGESEIR